MGSCLRSLYPPKGDLTYHLREWRVDSKVLIYSRQCKCCLTYIKEKEGSNLIIRICSVHNMANQVLSPLTDKHIVFCTWCSLFPKREAKRWSHRSPSGIKIWFRITTQDPHFTSLHMLVDIHKTTQLMSCVHGPSSIFENKDSGCWSPTASNWIWRQGSSSFE